MTNLLTIKKAICDEMLAYKKKVDELESSGNYNRDYGLDLHKDIINLMERVSKLEKPEVTIMYQVEYNSITAHLINIIEKLENILYFNRGISSQEC